MRALDTTQSFRLCDRLLLKEDGQEILAFDPDSLRVHQFNVSLARVAKLCNGNSSCEKLVVDFVETYGLDPHEASREVYRALKALDEHNLLESE